MLKHVITLHCETFYEVKKEENKKGAKLNFLQTIMKIELEIFCYSQKKEEISQ